MLRNCFHLVGVPFSYYSILRTTLAFSGFTYGGFLHDFKVGITGDVMLHPNRAVSGSAVVHRVTLPYFVGPDINNDDFNIAGIGATSRVRPTVTGTFSRNDRILVRTLVAKARMAYKVCHAGRRAHVFPVARMIASGRFFSCSTGCGNRISRVAPTHIDPRVATRIRTAARGVCGLLRTGNVVHISCVVKTSNGVGFLRIGAAPNVAVADFVPRRVHTTNLSVTSIVARVVRGRFLKVRRS